MDWHNPEVVQPGNVFSFLLITRSFVQPVARYLHHPSCMMISCTACDFDLQPVNVAYLHDWQLMATTPKKQVRQERRNIHSSKTVPHRCSRKEREEFEIIWACVSSYQLFSPQVQTPRSDLEQSKCVHFRRMHYLCITCELKSRTAPVSAQTSKTGTVSRSSSVTNTQSCCGMARQI